MVGIQNELGAIKIGLEMYDSPYNSKTFPFVRRVVALSLVVAFRCISNNIFFAFPIKLANNNTKSRAL